MKKLAIVTTHPIQYNAPWFKLLSQRGKVDLKVFYTWSQTEVGPKYDPTFQKLVEWDIPLLEGYPYQFVQNVSKDPGSHHFNGIDNPSLNKIITDWKPHAVLVIGWSYKSHLSCLRHFNGKVPVLFRGDSTLIDEKRNIRTVIRRVFLTWVYRHVDKVLYVGENNKAYFKAHGMKERQLFPAYHAVDNERFGCLTIDQQKTLERWRLSLDILVTDFVVLFAGKLEEKKNPFFLLKLADQIKDSQVVFLFVGNGHLEQQLKNLAGANRRIKFLDFQNQSLMPSVYALGNVLILPSKGPGETWGLAANEAMAAGLPVMLSSKAGGAVDLVKDNGIVFDPDDVEIVSNYITQLKNSPEKLNQASVASLQHIKIFSFSRLTEAVEKACGL